ncbi:MAG: L,D-transpeptidase family protein, partial [Fibrobacterota bacterium]
IELALRRRITFLSIRWQTYSLERDIRKAYNVSSFPFPALPVRAAADFAVSHPIISAVVPLLATATVLTLLFAPRPGTFHIPEFMTLHKKPAAEEPIVSIDRTVPVKPGQAAANEFFNALLADKTKKTLQVFRYFSDGRYEPIKTYSVSIGEKWGRKQKQGDLKTPEGLYWLIGRMEKHELLPLYGRRAFITNYPNENDIADKRTGTGIWIHGFEEGVVRDKTKGCIGLANPDLDDITQYIGIGTPVLITESCPAMPDSVKKYFDWKPMLEKRAAYIQKGRETNSFAANFVERWRVAWQDKDIEEYASLYAPDFMQDGMAFPEWKEYKRGIFERSQEITVNVSDVTLVRISGDSAFLRFTQSYESGVYKTVNGKVLKLVRVGDEWKIKEELRLTLN